MTTNVPENRKSQIIEQVMISGDLTPLTSEQRVEYYNKTCESIGLNPLTRPFDYIRLNNKLTLYARRDAADQLRKINKVSITLKSQQEIDGIYIVTASAVDAHGKTDEDVGAVTVQGLKGEAKANAILKAITKAKRRVTLSICGLGFLDETEVETIPEAREYLQQQSVAAKTEAKTAMLENKPAEKKPEPVAREKKAAPAPKAKKDEPAEIPPPPPPQSDAEIDAADAIFGKQDEPPTTAFNPQEDLRTIAINRFKNARTVEELRNAGRDFNQHKQKGDYWFDDPSEEQRMEFVSKAQEVYKARLAELSKKD